MKQPISFFSLPAAGFRMHRESLNLEEAPLNAGACNAACVSLQKYVSMSKHRALSAT